MNREEAIVSLGLDVNPFKRRMASFRGELRASMDDVATNAGKAFTQGWQKWVGALSIVGLVTNLRNLGQQYKDLEKDADGLKRKFGDLSEVEKATFSSFADSNADMDRALNKFQVGIVGGWSFIFETLTTMFQSRVGPGKAMDMIVADTLKAADELKAEMQKTPIDLQSEKEIQIIQQFNELRERLEMSRMNSTEKVQAMEKKISEYRALAAHEGATDSSKRYFYAGKILELEDAITKEKQEQLKLAIELAHQRIDLNDSARNTLKDAGSPSLDDLANNAGPMQGDAQKAKYLMDELKRAKIAGDQGKADSITRQLYGEDPGHITLTNEQQSQLDAIRAANNQRTLDGLPLLKEPEFKQDGLMGDLHRRGMAPDPITAQLIELRKELQALTRPVTSGGGLPVIQKATK